MGGFGLLPWLLVLGLLALGVRAWWGLRQATRDGREEWQFRQSRFPERAYGRSEEEFVRIHRRHAFPLGTLYGVGVVAVALLLSPVALGLMSAVWHTLWIWSGRPLNFSEGTLIWQFFLFFGLIAIWAGCAALAAWHYHRRPKKDLESLLRDGLPERDNLSG